MPMIHSLKTDPRKPVSPEMKARFQKIEPVVFQEDFSQASTAKRAAVKSGIEEYTGPWTKAEAATLAKKNTFWCQKK